MRTTTNLHCRVLPVPISTCRDKIFHLPSTSAWVCTQLAPKFLSQGSVLQLRNRIFLSHLCVNRKKHWTQLRYSSVHHLLTLFGQFCCSHFSPFNIFKHKYYGVCVLERHNRWIWLRHLVRVNQIQLTFAQYGRT